jgi:sarcosine oxidase subunit gamma
MIPKEGVSVDNISLQPEPFLGGYACTFGDTSLTEITDIELISISMPLNGRDKLQTSVRALWAVDLPTPGSCVATLDGKTRLLCQSPDSFLAFLSDPPSHAMERLQGAGYTTDQSDSWVILRLSGPLCLPALERICPIDLNTLSADNFARTTMEHLGVIILRQGPDDVMLLSASSSAGSFLHAVETSITNVEP